MSQPALAGPFGGAPGRSVPGSVRRWQRRRCANGAPRHAGWRRADHRPRSPGRPHRVDAGHRTSGHRRRDRRQRPCSHHRLSRPRGDGDPDPGRRARPGAGAARRLRSRDRLRSGARRTTAGSDPDPARRLGRGAAEPAADGGEQRRRAECGRRSTWSTGGILPVTGNTCSRTRSSPRRPMASSAAPPCSTGTGGWSGSARSWSTTPGFRTGRSRATCSCRSTSSSRSWAIC